MLRASRLLSVLSVALAAYLAFLLGRYFLSADLPRFRVETIFFWFLAVGMAAVWSRRATGSPHTRVDVEPGAWWLYPLLAAFLVAIAFQVYGSALRVGLLS